uniref:Phosphoglycerate kinase n=1 Tax=Oryza nivara TaxID=4536 RepID=A0A0E0ISJ9_ORYNI
MFARTHVIRPGPSPRRLIPRWLPPPNGTEAEATHLAAPRARDLRHLHGEKRASGSASSSSSTGRDGGGCPPGSVRADGSGAAATKERFSDSSASVRGARKDGLMQKACSVQLLRPSRSRRRESWPQLGGSVPPQSASVVHLEEEDKYSCIDHSTSYLHVQSVRDFPIEKLNAEVVLVRLDSELLCNPLGSCNLSLERTVSTIKYLHKAGAKVLLVTSWTPVLQSVYPVLKSTETFADYMSSLLQVKVVPKLASGAAIFVNDSFSLSHKMLASTVGITRFCHASLAGFHFEEELMQLRKITDTTRRPFIAIIGGSNFLGKAPALNLLASLCDGLFFVGKLSLQIMNGFGIPVPSCFVEKNSTKEVLQLIQTAHNRNIPIYYPTDTWCLNNKNNNHEKLEILDSAELLPGWTPADIGPSTLEKISSLIPLYKKVLWIGPTGFDLTEEFSGGAAQLGRILDKASHDSCDVILVGSAACKAVKGISGSSSKYTTFKNASVVLEFLKGKILPGVAALDKSYPYQIPWNAIFSDSSQPLVVDIGSGNGLFLFQMARNWEGSNFLGLEMNKKLVVRCLRDVASVDKRNLYFVSTNATSTFRSIVSSYPGQLALVTIQCPNPDFNIEQNRWRMVRRMLVEAIADLLQPNGKSDVESVLLGMKEQFMTHGKGQLVVDDDGGGDHQMDNPFGAASDWERHVLARGAPMYRTMLRKVSCKITKDETQS